MYLKKENQVAVITSEIISQELKSNGFIEMTADEIASYEAEQKMMNEIKPYAPTRDEVISNKLLENGYDVNRQLAILFNGNDTPEHAAELAAYQELRATIKREIQEVENGN